MLSIDAYEQAGAELFDGLIQMNPNNTFGLLGMDEQGRSAYFYLRNEMVRQDRYEIPVGTKTMSVDGFVSKLLCAEDIERGGTERPTHGLEVVAYSSAIRLREATKQATAQMDMAISRTNSFGRPSNSSELNDRAVRAELRRRQQRKVFEDNYAKLALKMGAVELVGVGAGIQEPRSFRQMMHDRGDE